MCSTFIRVMGGYNLFVLFLLFLSLSRIPQTAAQLKCGQRKVIGEYNNSSQGNDGRWPWHALVYLRECVKCPFKYYCAGSIIDNKHILISVLCVIYTDDYLNPSTYSVLVGRTDITEIINDFTQAHKVSKLILHPNYKHAGKLEDSLALIRLATRITMTDFIQPICLWQMDDSLKSVFGSSGLIVTDLKERYVIEVTTKILDMYTCVNASHNHYESYLKSNMYCAYGRMANRVGPEMVFLKEGNWFLRGISLFRFCNTRIEENRCSMKATGNVFLDIAKYTNWIAQYVTPTIPSNQWIATSKSNGNRLECGSRKINIQPLFYNAPEAKDGFWPWHAAVYQKRTQEFTYICGGTILDSNTILTAGHCLYIQHGLVPKDRIAVVLGQTQLNTDSSRTRGVSKLIPHPMFRPGDVSHDIALIQLSSSIIMTDYIQPICLWRLNTSLDWITHHKGAVPGFGETEKTNVSTHLREAIIDVVDHWTCIRSERDIYGKHLNPEMICGSGTQNVTACKGDSGGGLVYEFEGNWFIRGIVSFIPLNTFGTCDVTKYTVFTDVAHYVGWISQFVDPTIPANEIDRPKKFVFG